MSLETQIKLCSNHYRRWKSLALSSKTLEESRKCFERAFFWLELQTVFIALWSIEKLKTDPESKLRIMSAKANLSKRLTDYAEQILNEFKNK